MRRIALTCALFLLFGTAGAWGATRARSHRASHAGRPTKAHAARKRRHRRHTTTKPRRTASTATIPSAAAVDSVVPVPASILGASPGGALTATAATTTLAPQTTTSWATAANSAGASDPVLVGNLAVEANVDSDPPGLAEAFPVASSNAGAVQSLTMYLDSRSRSKTLILALYSNNGGHPGKLLTRGSLSAPKAGAWNTVSVAATPIASGTTYWLAALGSGGALYFRDRSNGPCRSENSSQTTLTSLPSSWSPGPAWDTCPASMYVSGTLSSSAPTGANSPTTSTTTPTPPSTTSTTTTTPPPTTSTTSTTPAPSGPAAPDAPSYTTQPIVSGSLEVGQTLTSTAGEWTGSPTAYSYQWEDCNLQGQSCSLVAGATGSSYTTQPSDEGATIRSIVTATNGNGSVAMYSGATGIITAGCSKTFTSSTSGSSPYPGSNINSAVSGAAPGTVLCLSGNVGQVDLYHNPTGRVYLESAPGQIATAGFNINGHAGGSSHITIQGLNTSGVIICDGGPSGCNITGDQMINNTLNGAVMVMDPPASSSIYLARNTAVNLNADTDQGVLGVGATYAHQCSDGVTIAHNTINGTGGDGIDSNSDCGTQIVGNIIRNVIQTGGPVACQEHCDGWQDNGGATNITMDGNLFLNDSDCWADLGSTSSTNLTITNNVCVTDNADSPYWAQFTASEMTFKHNTVQSTVGGEAGNNMDGASASGLVFTDNTQETTISLNPGQTANGSSENHNLCPAGTNFSCGKGSKDLTGSPTMVGGSTPGLNWPGYALVPSSAGVGAADDGTDMGISPAYFSVGSMSSPSGTVPGAGG